MDFPRTIRKRTMSHDSFVSGSPRNEKLPGLGQGKAPPSSFKGLAMQSSESERALLTKASVFKYALLLIAIKTLLLILRIEMTSSPWF